jgi:uncharacterized coiled-coil DUF342 family protein
MKRQQLKKTSNALKDLLKCYDQACEDRDNLKAEVAVMTTERNYWHTEWMRIRDTLDAASLERDKLSEELLKLRDEDRNKDICDDMKTALDWIADGDDDKEGMDLIVRPLRGKYNLANTLLSEMQHKKPESK